MKCLNAMVLKYEWCLITGEFLTQRTLKLLFIAYSLLQIFHLTKFNFIKSLGHTLADSYCIEKQEIQLLPSVGCTVVGKQSPSSLSSRW